MDKLNYKAGETAIISISGEALAKVSLLIINPSDKDVFEDKITLGPDGKKDYELDLTGYGSGVYTTVIIIGTSQNKEVFSVGLQTGSGPIKINTTKDTYKPRDTILILGNSGPNIIISLTLYDPEGKEVKTRETFTNKVGIFSEDRFRVPSDAKFGVWKIKASSGPNFKETEFSVTPSIEQGMSIEAFEVTDPKIAHLGKSFKINGFGAPVTQRVTIEIFSIENDFNEEPRSVTSTKNGDFQLIWFVPANAPPGEYTIKAIASNKIFSAETTIDVG